MIIPLLSEIFLVILALLFTAIIAFVFATVCRKVFNRDYGPEIPTYIELFMIKGERDDLIVENDRLRSAIREACCRCGGNAAGRCRDCIARDAKNRLKDSWEHDIRQ